MILYCGIDLHSNNSVVSLIDDADQLISEKRLDNDLKKNRMITGRYPFSRPAAAFPVVYIVVTVQSFSPSF